MPTTYKDLSNAQSPWFHPVAPLIYTRQHPERTYATGDIIRFIPVHRDLAVYDAWICSDSSAGATATVDLVLTDGTTTVVLVNDLDISVAAFGRMATYTPAGYVVPTAGFELRAVMGTIATAAAAKISVGLAATNYHFAADGALEPAG